MNDPFDTILRKTLDDYRLSRGERRVLQSALTTLDASEHQLAVYRHRAFELAREELLSPGAKQVLDWLEDVLKVMQPQAEPSPEGNTQAYFSPGAACLDQINEQIASARRTIDICVFTITDNRISDRLVRAHARGIRTRVITDNDKSHDFGSDIDRLRTVGIPVRVDQTEFHMHHKFAIFDAKTMLTGSYNWTRSAAERNEENLVVSTNLKLTSQYVKAFEDLWEQLQP